MPFAAGCNQGSLQQHTLTCLKQAMLLMSLQVQLNKALRRNLAEAHAMPQQAIPSEHAGWALKSSDHITNSSSRSPWSRRSTGMYADGRERQMSSAMPSATLLLPGSSR